MRRSFIVRLIVGLWAVWFNAALLEAPGIHTCALHSGVASAGHQHGSAEMPMHEHAAHSRSSSDKSNDGACTCLGMCCGVSPFVATGTTPDIVAHYVSLTARRIGHDVVAPSVERPYERPFANGPPSLV